VGLYVLYNVAAAMTSVPAGRLADAATPVRVLSLGVAAFALAYLGFVVVGASVALLAVFFVAAGVGIGAVETAEHSAVATLARDDLRGSSFGALAAIQSFGNLIASAVVGVLYTTVSPTAAFLVPAVAMLVALLMLVTMRGRTLQA
jgi:MFS family permease